MALPIDDTLAPGDPAHVAHHTAMAQALNDGDVGPLRINEAVTAHATDQPHLGPHTDGDHTTPARIRVTVGATTVEATRLSLIPGAGMQHTMSYDATTKHATVTSVASAGSGGATSAATLMEPVTFAGTPVAGATSQRIQFSYPVMIQSVSVVLAGASTTQVVVDLLRGGKTSTTSVFADAGQRPLVPAGRITGRSMVSATVNAGEFVQAQIVTTGTEALSPVVTIHYVPLASAYLDLWSNTGEGGVGAVTGGAVTLANSAAPDAFSAVTVGTGSAITYAATTPPAGLTRYLRVSTPGGVSDAYVAEVFPEVAESWHRIAFRLPTVPGSPVRIVRGRNGAAHVGSVQVTTSQRLQLIPAAGTPEVALSAAVIPLNTWVMADIGYTHGPGGGLTVIYKGSLTAGAPTDVISGPTADLGVGLTELNWGRTGTGATSTAYAFDMALLGSTVRGRMGLAA